MAPTWAIAMASRSQATPSGAPWKLPHDSMRPSGSTIGLSIAEMSSMRATPSAYPAASRAAPCTCGVQRSE